MVQAVECKRQLRRRLAVDIQRVEPGGQVASNAIGTDQLSHAILPLGGFQGSTIGRQCRRVEDARRTKGGGEPHVPIAARPIDSLKIVMPLRWHLRGIVLIERQKAFDVPHVLRVKPVLVLARFAVAHLLTWIH
jgi:hypothetical protein